MPIMDGYQAAKNIRDIEKSQLNLNDRLAYIIGLTAHSTESYKIHCFESGMNEFSKFLSINIWPSYSDQAYNLGQVAKINGELEIPQT